MKSFIHADYLVIGDLLNNIKAPLPLSKDTYPRHQ